MIYESEEGVYLFGFNTKSDGHFTWDELYVSLEDVKEEAEERFGVESNNWTVIPEPMENYQHDWIIPGRIKGSLQHLYNI